MKQNKPFVIGLSGLSGSGKTFYINHLKKILKDDLSIISFDDYYRPIEELVIDENGVPNFDLPSALYSDLYLEHLNDLIAGKRVEKEQYQFELENPASKTLTIEPAPVIMAEGLFIFEIKPIRELLDLKVFLSSDEAVCLNRRLKRDTEERGITKERSSYQWTKHVMPAYEKYILPYKPSCELKYHNEGTPSDNLNHLTKTLQERTGIVL